MKQRLLWIVTLLGVSLISVLASCQSTPTSIHPSGSGTITNTPPSTTTAQSQRVSGTITQVNGNTLTLTTQQGTTIVSVGSGAIIQMITAGTISDLHTGDTLSIMGTKDANGNITATSIIVRPQGQGARPTRTAPTTPLPRGTPPPATGSSPNPRFPSGGAGNGTYGTLTQINGNTLTLTTTQGTVNVTISSDTSIQLTEIGTLSNLNAGQSVTIMGTGNAEGNLTANYIIIQPQSQSAPQTQAPASSTLSSSSAAASAPAPSSGPTASVDIGIYSVLGAQPITNLEFGSLQQGASSTQFVILEDLGSQNVTVTVSCTGLANGLTLTGDSLTLSPGLTSTGSTKVFQMALVLSAGGNAATGDCNFTINFNNLKIPSHVDVIGTPSSTTAPPTTTAIVSTPTSSSGPATNVDIGIYSDAKCTQPVTNLEFGNLQQGASSTQVIFFEDLGSQNVTVTVSCTGLANGLTLTGDSLTLSPGLTSTGSTKVFQMALVLSAGGNAATGDCNFTINFNNLEIPSHVDVIGTPSSTTAPPTTTAIVPTPTSSSGPTTNVDIGIYSDAKCTQPVTNLDFGNLQQDASNMQIIFFKDLGSQNVTVTVSSTALANGLTLTGGPLTLSPGPTPTGTAEGFPMLLVLSAGGNAAIGDCNFTINFNNLEIPGHAYVY